MERSELLHVMLNVMKTVWCVWVGTPRPASLWTPNQRLAVLWKFGLDTLMVSGLGELVSLLPCNLCLTAVSADSVTHPGALASALLVASWRFGLQPHIESSFSHAP